MTFEVAVKYAETTLKTVPLYPLNKSFLLFMNIRENELFRMRRRVVWSNHSNPNGVKCGLLFMFSAGLCVYVHKCVCFVGMPTYSYTDETPLRCNPVLSIYATPSFFRRRVG